MNTSNEFHVQFVSNHNGSFPSDVIYATLPATFSVALNSVVLSSALSAHRYFQHKYSSRLLIHLLIESCTILLPILLGFTYLSDNSLMNSVYILFVTTSLMLLEPDKWIINIQSLRPLFDIPVPEKKPPFVTNYRAGMNLATAICILAVDFQIFPRRFAKTETYGISLMDVGVGSFVFAHGLAGSSHMPMLKMLKKILPIAALGFLRLLAVKLTNYHEHVTEYGIHWNFFFTLALVKGCSAMVQSNLPPAILSVGLLVVYEFALKCGLENWILSDYPRNNLLAANREGVFSFFGYLALFYAATQLGNYLKKPKNTLRDWITLFGALVVVSFIGWISLEISNRIFGVSSRRLANASFCVWMLTYNSVIMAAYLLVDIFLLTFELRREFSDSSAKSLEVFREPYLMRFINYNGLVFFLLANVLTGLVNMTFNTIHMYYATSMIILFLYCLVLGSFVAVMYAWRIRI